jgi:hypothetical protein
MPGGGTQADDAETHGGPAQEKPGKKK